SSPVPGDRLIISRAEGSDTRFIAIDRPEIEISGTDYSFTDNSITAGIEYRYRLAYLSDEGEEVLFETETIETSPSTYLLFQNRPNPFNPSTEIAYSLPETAHVSIEIFDVSGRRITLLLDDIEPAGRHKVVWDGLDQAGNAVSSGIYFYRITAGKWSQARKMVLMR
ncbi:MAG TPA: FlgD immunoglobulin-like domain containing protein, partial [Candidatus Krumholzibacterium sp.]|nr:FlgD immunoglobulin-like domain containing protein [Candidatus Krumholzibacterium sp.]